MLDRLGWSRQGLRSGVPRQIVNVRDPGCFSGVKPPSPGYRRQERNI